MTTFLRSLLAREGSSNLLRPRPVARFEGGLGAAPEQPRSAAEVAVRPVVRRPAERAPEPVARPLASEPAAPAMAVAAAPGASQPVAAAPALTPVVPAGSVESPGARPSESPRAAAFTASHTVTQENERTLHETVIRERSSEVLRELAPAAAEPPITVAPSVAASPRSEPVAQRPPASPGEAERSAVPAAPSLQISIGRIEVRAVSPVAPPARRRSAAPAALSLDRYLSQRGGGKP